MKKERTILLGIFITALLLLVPLSSAVADMGSMDGQQHHHQENRGPQMHREGMQVLLSSDMFQIMVNAELGLPFYHFNTTLNEGMFFLIFRNLVQYQDLDSDGMYDENETVGGHLATLDLSKVEWDLVVLNDSNTLKEFAFRSKRINVTGFENTSIELVNRFSGGTAIKFDIKITSWPFVEEATGLSLEMEMHWGKMTEADRERVHSSMAMNNESMMDDESTHQHENYTTSHRSSMMSMPHQNMSSMMPHDEMMPPVKILGNSSGIYLQDDQNVTLAFFKVITDVIIDGVLVQDGVQLQHESTEETSALFIRLNYPKFNQTLWHDPEFGTTSQALSVTGIDLSTLVSFFSSLTSFKQGFLLLTGLMTLLIVGIYMILVRKNQ